LSVKQEKTNQKSPLSIPSKWQEKFVLKRIKEENMYISLETRNAILAAMERGQNFVQVGKYTLMINSISSIEPVWGPSNIPPCPKKQFNYRQIESNGQTIVVEEETEESKKERELWSRCFPERKEGQYLAEKLFLQPDNSSPKKQGG